MKTKKSPVRRGRAISYLFMAGLFFSCGWIARSQFEIVKCNVIKTIVEAL